MSISQDAPIIIEKYNKIQKTLWHNATLFDIFEGNLLPYVLADLKQQLSPQSYEQIENRVSPINLLKRVIDKLSRIYSKPPIRKLEGDSTDQLMLDWYFEQMTPNTVMPLGNEFFNLFKNTAYEPYLDFKGTPKLRTIPSDRFFVCSFDETDPMRVTHFVKIMGKKQNEYGQEKLVFYIYTDTEFVKIDEDKRIIEPASPNPYRKIPFIYVVRSRHNLIPICDTDTLTMTKLFPVLLSDLNLATMFQCFSILYGIDVDEEGLKMAPNAFWRFKSDPASKTEPKVGIIKPEVDTDKVLGLIQNQLAMWLQSRNIRPGGTGKVDAENFSRGVSKMVDEMDTSEDRTKQIPFFVEAENSLWDLIMHNMHPVWIYHPLYEQKGLFSASSKVSTVFPEQLPMLDRAAVVTYTVEELNAGLVDRKTAIKRLNPDLDDDQIDDLLEAIDRERTVEMPNGNEPAPTDNPEDMKNGMMGEDNASETPKNSN